MSMVRVIERPDGGTSVVHLTPEHLAKHGGDETTALESIAVPDDAVSSEVIDSANLPNRTFRNAWKKGDGTVTVDMTMARDIHLNVIRIVRNSKLIVEDANWTMAADQAAKDIVEARRLALRDLPHSSQTATDVAAALTPEALDAIWPEVELGARE